MMIKTTIFTHCPLVSLTQFSLCWWRHNRLLMISQLPDICDVIMWIVISNSLDIDFIHGEIQGRSCKKIHIFQCLVRYFMWNINSSLWNSTQNILPTHWKMQLVSNIEISRALDIRACKHFLNTPWFSNHKWNKHNKIMCIFYWTCCMSQCVRWKISHWLLNWLDPDVWIFLRRHKSIFPFAIISQYWWYR